MADVKRRSPLRFLMEGFEGLIVAPLAIVTWPLTKRWLDDWGSTTEERQRTWLGDALAERRDHVHSRAITIEASADVVWPWLTQLGLGRAGFYSYELLERLGGVPVTNIEQIDGSLETLSVGDEIFIHPKAPGIPIAYLEEPRHICFGVAEGPGVTAEDRARSWSLYVEPITNESCRLVSRSCLVRPKSWKARAALAFGEPIDFTMEQRMLRSLKRLAEASKK